MMFPKDKEKDSNNCVGTASLLLAIRKKRKSDLNFGGWQKSIVGTVKDKYCLFLSMQEESINNTVYSSWPLRQSLYISQETSTVFTVVIGYKFSKYFQQCKLAEAIS